MRTRQRANRHVWLPPPPPNPLYERQDALRLNTYASIHVVGCGGIGFWLGLFHVMSGTTNATFWDSDMLELSNLNRLPYTRDDIGKNKAELLKAFCLRLRPDASIIAMPHIQPSDYPMLGDHQTVYDCTDSFGVQASIARYCRDHRINYIRVGYDGTHGSVADNTPDFATDEEVPVGYEHAPSWVVPSAFFALLGVAKTTFIPLHNLECCFDMSELTERLAEHPAPTTPAATQIDMEQVERRIADAQTQAPIN